MKPADEDQDIAARLLSLQLDSPLLIALFDERDGLRYANPAFCAALDVAPDERICWVELMRRNYRNGRGTLIQTRDFEAWLASAKSRRAKLPFRAFETDLADGRWIWMTETTQPGGWMLCVGSDITDLRVGERELRQARDLAQRAALTDPLTGLGNRGHILQQLEGMLAQFGHGACQAAAIAILDLDHFKLINDVQGHLAGDAVLRDFAHRLQPLLKPHDSLGRLGGEEFLLLAPGSGLEQAEALLQAILIEVQASRPLAEAPAFTYTCSAGMTLLRGGDDLMAALARADEALYQAKAGGRNTWRVRL
ncbi:GGDEF domain-containing protein [Chromobacterium subtsugae]|uniref:diguanylate cyclase n=1 Tax=Chromobacterium subtsugae TaxID=251747 RepID=A0ABS7FFR6_9NEIS|nr:MULTISPECIES: GGDEF domain-containing protein [Chromobacterium]KUM03975.1 diguanylate cyclase [Chromobacterium subtsugae]KZE86436.1 diguanylate cyclase [Chromobacterium sp. F49]MBW7567695.1 diguanylate cyclase [Chromobacterium subtsugae]MBW8288921.1 GGDEF domain-containing protein [Chromobacterium subtsugae]OBU85690.1 diguanylate cyclase [Chromobacterium subtsugae]